MQQMPEEGRLFQTVDKNWKEIMRFVMRDPHVKKSLYFLLLNFLFIYFKLLFASN